jgi:ATP-dependent Lon protease
MTLPLLPLREMVVFPQSVQPLAIGQERSVRLVDEVLGGDRRLVLALSRRPELEEPGPEDLHDVGVTAQVHRMVRVPDGSVRILVQGIDRVRIARVTQTEPFLACDHEELPDTGTTPTPALEALMRNVVSLFTRIVELSPGLPEELGMTAQSVEEAGLLSYLVASAVRSEIAERQQLLEERDVERRLRRVSSVLTRELELLELGSRIQSEVASEIDRGQREYFLRQQLKAIQEELGETDEAAAEINELRARLDEAALPEEADRQARRELDRLAKLPPAAAEHGVIRTYLDWILSLPWNAASEDDLDLAHARGVLDEDHYDLDKVKERILEYLAVSKLKGDLSGAILCFAGPPGVGKTSLGQSIARALGRRFVRVSVGGMRDESEVRGHRRTYIGAMPGTIVRALRDAGTRNPVFMIDEIDKMGADWRGDPASAMLELLDPAQQANFRDHYLDLPFDVSKVLFICTANQLEPIPAPLRDRMEIIQLEGYTLEQKLHIARRYLLPRQTEANGLRRGSVRISDATMRTIIHDQTREAGVRGLERAIGAICRKAAARVAEGSLDARERLVVSRDMVREWLGRPRVPPDVEIRRRVREPGVATGLAWTPVGGEVLFVEAVSMPGEGRLLITGQLGDVMQESARAALSYLRSRPGVGDAFAGRDIHVHVPSGAVPKDGPSAGVTIATALTSLATGRAVRRDVAMTGEITLTGRVLPVGGIKEKVLAAQRAGVKTAILPRANEPDLEDVPADIRERMRFVFAESLDDVLAEALERRRAPGAAARSAAGAADRVAAAGRTATA